MPNRNPGLTMDILFNRFIPLPEGTVRYICGMDLDHDHAPKVAFDCKTHGERQRAKILSILADGGCYATDLESEIGISASSIKRHMAKLEAEGKVKWTDHPIGNKPRKFFELGDSK